jgi:hypothetical protein
MNSSISGNSILSTPSSNTHGKSLLTTFDSIIEREYALRDLRNFLLTHPSSIPPLRFDSDGALVPSDTDACSLWLHDLPGIFKIDTSKQSRVAFLKWLKEFSWACDLIKRRCQPHNLSPGELKKLREKIVKVYNNALNYFKQHLAHDECDDDIARKRSLIRNMQLYAHPFVFSCPQPIGGGSSAGPVCGGSSAGPVGGGSSAGPVGGGSSARPVGGGSSAGPVRGVENPVPNWDASMSLSNHHRIRVRKTVSMKDGTPQPGAAFDFDGNDEAFSMACAALEETGTRDMKWSHDRTTRLPTSFCSPCGSLMLQTSTFPVVFDLSLNLRHISVLAPVLSSGTQIRHQLLGNVSLRSHIIAQYLNDPESLRHPGIVRELGFFLPFHLLVQQQIGKLIDASANVPSFPWWGIQCYRPECGAHNVYEKAGINLDDPNLSARDLTVSCRVCRIGEFCLKCRNSSHRGDCEMVDAATDAWVQENTVPCPNCRYAIYKYTGCNHMHCQNCKIHFCWTCGEEYTLNDINTHYQNANPFAACRGVRRGVPVPVPAPAPDEPVPAPDEPVPAPDEPVPAPDEPVPEPEPVPVLRPDQRQRLEQLVPAAQLARLDVADQLAILIVLADLDLED